MAGDWIKFELATLDKPEVLHMSEVLGMTAYDVVGRLLRVWGWFDQQTRNGNAVSVTGDALKRFIDRIAERQGFAGTMALVGWLNDEGIPNFDRHNGKPAKERALTNERVKRSRNGESVTEALPEKRREEKKHISGARAKKGTPIPEDFIVTDRVLKWAAQRGLSSVIELHREAFICACKAKDYRYVDWDEAFMNAVRNNWARIETPKTAADGSKRPAI